MSDSDTDATEEKTKKGGMKKLLVGLVVAVIGIGAGFATPILLDGSAAEKDSKELTAKTLDIPEATEELAFLDFEEVVINLKDARFSRFLKIDFSMQISKPQVAAITEILEDNRVILKNWLLSHVADKSPEDIRGKKGYNQLRREIHDKFNAMMFPDGIERIQDILFKEFNIQ